MEDISLASYASAISTLMYSMVCIRLDITQAMGVLCRFMANFGREDWVAMKRVFRYLRVTIEYFVFYHSDVSQGIHGYVDYEWAGDVDRRRSTSGCGF